MAQSFSFLIELNCQKLSSFSFDKTLVKLMRIDAAYVLVNLYISQNLNKLKNG